MQEKLENTFLKNTFLKTNSKFVKILHCAPNAKWHSSSCTKCIVEGFKEVFGVRKVLLAIRFKWQIGFLCIRLSHYILVEIRLPESWPGFITANKKILFVWKTSSNHYRTLKLLRNIKIVPGWVTKKSFFV